MTRTEKKRISDALYRMKKEGFIFPEGVAESVRKTITDASSYKAIRRKFAEGEGVLYRPIRPSGRKAEGVIPGTLAQEYIEKSAEWNKQRTRFRKKGEVPYDEKSVPRYNPGSMGPSRFQTRFMTQEQVNKAFEEAAKRQIRYMTDYTPATRMEEMDRQSRKNALDSLDQQIVNSPHIKQMFIDGMNRMGQQEWKDFLKTTLGKKLTEAFYGSGTRPEALMLGETGDEEIKIPILLILKKMGYDINAPAEDSDRGETIAQYVERLNLAGIHL